MDEAFVVKTREAFMKNKEWGKFESKSEKKRVVTNILEKEYGTLCTRDATRHTVKYCPGDLVNCITVVKLVGEEREEAVREIEGLQGSNKEGREEPGVEKQPDEKGPAEGTGGEDEGRG